MEAFEYHGIDLRFNKVFNNGMFNHSTIIMKKITETYKGFEGVSTLVDVGGGIGASLNMIVSKYPKINGINFDLPHVVQHAPTRNGSTTFSLIFHTQLYSSLLQQNHLLVAYI